MTIDIIGKNASIDSFPPQFFESRNTLGLNHISWALRTKKVITVYPQCAEEFISKGFSAANVVGIRFNPPKPDSMWGRHEKLRPNEVEGLGSYIGYDWRHHPKEQDVETHFTHALSGNFLFGYRTYGTVLHLAIFWAIATGHRELNIFGCNHTNHLTIRREHGWPVDSSPAEFAGMMKWTKPVVKQAKNYGVAINWWKDYDEYTKGILFYGD